jgi:hypothetical protein
VSSETTHAVLAAIVAHADGAGWAYLSVDTLIAESGVRRRSVFRALDALERDELIERHPTKRPKGARPGQGATTYRLGAAIRIDVGLYDREWAPAIQAAPPTAETGSLAHPERAPSRSTGTPRIDGTGTPGNPHREPAPTGTPGAEPLAHPDEQEEPPPDVRFTGTPERRNGNNPSPIGADVEPQTSEADLARARDDDPDETDRLITLVRGNTPPVDHPGDLLAAELLAALPGTVEVDHDDEGWTTVASGPAGTLAIRHVPARLVQLSPTVRLDAHHVLELLKHEREHAPDHTGADRGEFETAEAACDTTPRGMAAT